MTKFHFDLYTVKQGNLNFTINFEICMLTIAIKHLPFCLVLILLKLLALFVQTFIFLKLMF